MHFNNDSRMMNDCARRSVLRSMRIYQGKPITYESFLRQYLKAFAFTYHLTGADSKKYRRITLQVEALAKLEWDKLEKA